MPESYKKRGGVFFPIYQSEAMWIKFDGEYPCAIKIAAGKINAVDGKPWKEELNANEQDYIVSDKQPWLDGFNISKNISFLFLEGIFFESVSPLKP